MKREIFQEIEIPSGVEANIVGNTLTVKGAKGEIKRRFDVSRLVFEKKGDKILIGGEKATKNDKRNVNTTSAHIRNMIQGVKEGFEYKLKVAHSHFPVSVSLEGNQVSIKNFLGEKIPRKMKIIDGVHVKIQGDTITVTSHDKEIAGRTAASFERATRIRLRDRRVFQDGIFIVSKAGKNI